MLLTAWLVLMASWAAGEERVSPPAADIIENRLWVVIKPQKNPSKNCDALQKAIDDPAHKGLSVVIEPGKVLEVDCKIVVGNQKTLLVPSDTELVYQPPESLRGDRVAVEVQGGGQLLGNGTLRVAMKNPSKPAPEEFLQASRPRTGVLLSGSEGIVSFGRIHGFEYGLHFFGNGVGSAYNDVRVRKILNSLQAIRVDSAAAGWANQNYVHVSRIASNLASSHPEWEKTYGIYIDSHSQNLPNANRFSGSIENIKTGVRLSGMYNRLDGLRLELPENGIKIEIDHTSHFNENCKKIGMAGRCFPTKNNWWFGEYGKIDPNKDLVLSAGFKKTPQIQKTDAIRAYGVEGLDSPAAAPASSK